MPSCRLPLQGGCVKRVMKPATSKTRIPRRRGWSNLGSRFKDGRDHRHEGRRLCRAINPDGKCPDDCMASRGQHDQPRAAPVVRSPPRGNRATGRTAAPLDRSDLKCSAAATPQTVAPKYRISRSTGFRAGIDAPNRIEQTGSGIGAWGQAVNAPHIFRHPLSPAPAPEKRATLSSPCLNHHNQSRPLG